MSTDQCWENQNNGNHINYEDFRESEWLIFEQYLNIVKQLNTWHEKFQ